MRIEYLYEYCGRCFGGVNSLESISTIFGVIFSLRVPIVLVYSLRYISDIAVAGGCFVGMVLGRCGCKNEL